MKVILLQKVPGLGDIDEVKEVNEGYARNFLFPKHLAVQASTKMISDLKAKHEREAKMAERELKSEQQLADKLSGLEIEMKEKANDSGLLYAAVGPQKISQALQKFGCVVDKKQIVTPGLKTVGDYRVKIKLQHGLEAEISVIVSS